MTDHQIRIWKGSEHLELSLQIKALPRSWAREAREIALHSLASLRHIGLLQTSCALQTIITLHLINLYLMLYIGCLEIFFTNFILSDQHFYSHHFHSTYISLLFPFVCICEVSETYTNTKSFSSLPIATFPRKTS